MRILYLYRLSVSAFVLCFCLPKKSGNGEPNLIISREKRWELKQIEKKFYRHLSQVFLELFRIRWFKAEDLGKYMHLMHDSEALLRSYKDKGKSFILCTGHTGNWEWGSFNTSNIFGDYNLKVYKPLSNQYFDNYVNKLRSRFGGKMVAMSQVAREINKNINNGFCLSMLADQSPPPEHAYWTMFLNQETAFFAGIGKLAVKYRLDVLYYNIKKVKNGYYEIAIEILSLAEENLREEEIQERFIRRLEKSIVETPFSWLWSHRRWKHKKPANLSQ